jgi:hypothetical protein
VVIRKRITRAKLLEFFAALPSCLVGVEACPTAHYWTRVILPARRGFAASCGPLFSDSSRKLHYALVVAMLVVLDHRLNVPAPKIERRFLFCRIARSVVDASDASLVAADVVEHSLDDVRLHAKFGHAGSDSAPYIMQPP